MHLSNEEKVVLSVKKSLIDNSLFFLHTITQKRTTFRSQFYELNVVLSIKITLVFQYFMYASKNQL